MNKVFYPRKDEVNSLLSTELVIGISFIIISIILFSGSENFALLSDFMFILIILFFAISGCILIYAAVWMGGGYLKIDNYGIEFVKKNRTKKIYWTQIKEIRRGDLDLGDRRYFELEISLKEEIFRPSDIWRYWNMLSFVMSSEIGLDERHWHKEDLVEMAEIVEEKLGQRSLKIDEDER